MVFILGLIVVIASVTVGYTMHAGDLSLLWQPNEIIIIVGAGFGSMLIGNPISTLKKLAKDSKTLVAGGVPYHKSDYLELLLFCFNVFKLMKAKGMLAIESHIENTEDSDLFARVPSLKKDNFAYNFVQDNLRMLTMGADNPYQFEDFVNKELEVYEDGVSAPSQAVLTLADALPALGIVAAVLGVIVTMRSIAEPPEVLGALIAAALVGTFTGVLLSYGFIGPIGHLLAKSADYKLAYLECIKVGFIAYLNNHPPIIIVECMRKCIPDVARPTFQELDSMIAGDAIKM